MCTRTPSCQGIRDTGAAIFVGCRSFSSFAVPRKQPAPSILSITPDSKTGRQQWISVDVGGNSIGLWSGWKTSVDGGRRVIPKGGHGPFRPPASTDVLPVPFHPRRRPPVPTIIRCYLPVTVSERVSVRSIPSPLQGAGNSPGSRFNPP